MKDMVIGLMIALALLVAGCTIPGSEPVGGATIAFYGSMDRTSGGFVMRGELAIEGGVPERNAFDDTTIFLCSEAGNTIESKPIGRLHDGTRTNLSLTTAEEPYFVVINSPDFWKENAIGVQYYRWMENESGYGVSEVTREAQLPCGT